MGARLTFSVVPVAWVALLGILAGCGARGGYDLLGEGGGRVAAVASSASSSSGAGGFSSSSSTGGVGGLSDGGGGGEGGEGGFGGSGQGGQGAGPLCQGLSASALALLEEPVSNSAQPVSGRVALSMNANWRHGLAWLSGNNVMAQVFELASPIGPAAVLSTGAGFPRTPDIAQLSGGGAIVVWVRNGGVIGRRINAAGAASGAEVPLSQGGEFVFSPPAVAAGPDDALAFAYVAQGSTLLRLRTFSSNGSSLGGATVTSGGTQVYGAPDVAVDGQNNITVAWRSTFGTAGDVFVQRYNLTGVPLGPTIAVTGSGVISKTPPSIDMALDGRFVVSFVDQFNNVQAKAYSADGFPATGFIAVDNGQSAMVSTEFMAGQNAPNQRLAVADDGTFVVSWVRQGTAQRTWRRFEADGAPLTDPQQSGQASWAPAVAIEPCGGRSTMAWPSGGVAYRAVFGP